MTIAASAAGTVIGVNLTAKKQKDPSAPLIISLTQDDYETNGSLKIGDGIHLTVHNYGDGGLCLDGHQA